ncbi:pickpocket protein 19 [Andrena cerasifolii]|uniref:pickpocket protein 19 n=1 Tax=Andrena cerasifolii TaxID=2819439 RepID=UPI004037AF9C
MPKVAVNLAPKEIGANSFLDKEILPDLQARRKATLQGIKSVPEDVPNHVGMQAINPKSNVGKYMVEFASASSIHGLNHLVAPNRHPIEKLLAVLFIVGALLCLIFLSALFWDRFQNSATVIVVDNDRDRFRIPKPAVYICPDPNIEEGRISDVFERHGVERAPDVEQFFTFLANVDYEKMSATPLFDKVPPSKWLEILYDLRKDVPPNVLKEDDPYETWVTTERGVCLVSRSVFAVYATHEYWASNNLTVIPIPKEVPYYDHNNDKSQESIALKVSAHFGVCDPFEILSYDIQMRLIRQKVLQRAIMSISEIKTAAKVRELRVHQRKCKFFSDGGLKAWPVYTWNMCVEECRMRVIQDRCKCRPHFTRVTGDVNICNAMQLRCIGNITSDLFLYEYPPPFCGCDPNCNVVKYQMRDSEKSELYYTPISLSIVSLIINFPQVIYYRSLMYGFTDFLTGVGGAAGLFLGASVLSFVEIFYYATLRVCFYVRYIKLKYKN